VELITTGCWGSQTDKWIRKAIKQINGREVHQSPLNTKPRMHNTMLNTTLQHAQQQHGMMGTKLYEEAQKKPPLRPRGPNDESLVCR